MLLTTNLSITLDGQLIYSMVTLRNSYGFYSMPISLPRNMAELCFSSTYEYVDQNSEDLHNVMIDNISLVKLPRSTVDYIHI